MRPTLTTDRIRLEPLTLEHTEELVALDADPAVHRHLTGRGLTREEVVAQMARRVRPEADALGIGYWAGYAVSSGDFLGWWSLMLHDDEPDAGELGYRLRRDAWGHGFATEGALALVEHAFATAGLRRVWAETMAVNTGSRAVLEKVGLRHVRTEVRDWDEPLPGAELGEVVYELLNPAVRTTT